MRGSRRFGYFSRRTSPCCFTDSTSGVARYLVSGKVHVAVCVAAMRRVSPSVSKPLATTSCRVYMQRVQALPPGWSRTSIYRHRLRVGFPSRQLAVRQAQMPMATEACSHVPQGETRLCRPRCRGVDEESPAAGGWDHRRKDVERRNVVHVDHGQEEGWHRWPEPAFEEALHVHRSIAQGRRRGHASTRRRRGAYSAGAKAIQHSHLYPLGRLILATRTDGRTIHRCR